jgi:GT2 family glycosyltransferase
MVPGHAPRIPAEDWVAEPGQALAKLAMIAERDLKAGNAVAALAAIERSETLNPRLSTRLLFLRVVALRILKLADHAHVVLDALAKADPDLADLLSGKSAPIPEPVAETSSGPIPHFTFPRHHDRQWIGVDVIVPVYGDVEATRQCLQSLADLPDDDLPLRFTLVDDAAPDPAMDALLRIFEAQPRFRLLRHSENRGFAAAVNTGIGQSEGNDVLVLNADTIVPPRLIQRLRHHAATGVNIGTVMPLTNNGEYASYPRPFEENPLPSSNEIALRHERLGREMDGQAIDVPSAIGFCLYIRAALIAKIGGLSEAYGRGYYEDVDFGLRAAEAGYRNRLALDCYIGHAGGRSFSREKHRLVMRNKAEIEKRFPNAVALSEAFLAAREAHQLLAPALLAEILDSKPKIALFVPAAMPDYQQLCWTRRLIEGQSGIVIRVSGIDSIAVEAFRVEDGSAAAIRWQVETLANDPRLSSLLGIANLNCMILGDALAVWLRQHGVLLQDATIVATSRPDTATRRRSKTIATHMEMPQFQSLASFQWPVSGRVALITSGDTDQHVVQHITALITDIGDRQVLLMETTGPDAVINEAGVLVPIGQPDLDRLDRQIAIFEIAAALFVSPVHGAYDPLAPVFAAKGVAVFTA